MSRKPSYDQIENHLVELYEELARHDEKLDTIISRLDRITTRLNGHERDIQWNRYRIYMAYGGIAVLSVIALIWGIFNVIL